MYLPPIGATCGFWYSRVPPQVPMQYSTRLVSKLETGVSAGAGAGAGTGEEEQLAIIYYYSCTRSMPSIDSQQLVGTVPVLYKYMEYGRNMVDHQSRLSTADSVC